MRTTSPSTSPTINPTGLPVRLLGCGPEAFEAGVDVTTVDGVTTGASLTGGVEVAESARVLVWLERDELEPEVVVWDGRVVGSGEVEDMIEQTTSAANRY